MNVIVLGPNLPRKLSAKGTLHVHATDCADILKYPVENDWVFEAESKRVVVEECYPPEQFDWSGPDDMAYWGDVWFAPCTKALPKEAP